MSEEEKEEWEEIKVEMDAEEKWADFFIVYGDPRAFTIVAGYAKTKFSGKRKGKEMRLHGETPDVVKSHTILKTSLESAENLRNLLDVQIRKVKKESEE